MIKASVSLKDMDGFDAQYDEIVKAVSGKLREVAEVAKESAKTTSAFADKSGVLRSSIKMRKSRYEDGGYVVFTKQPHSHLVEFGHVMIAWGHVTGKRVPPHPYMRPAAQKAIKAAVEAFRNS